MLKLTLYNANDKKYGGHDSILNLFFFLCRFTCLQAYKNLLNELGDQAGQHEMIAENLSTSVVQELSTLVKQLKDDRRKVRRQKS